MVFVDMFVGVIEVVGVAITFARNREIYGDGERADYVYKVVSGAVRTYKVLADGRRQIGAFYLTGDVFGLEVGDEHALAAEAVTEAKVLVVKRSALIGLASRDSEIARELWALMSRELARGQARILLLVRPRRSGSSASCSRWPSVGRPSMPSSFRCRGRTSRIIWAS